MAYGFVEIIKTNAKTNDWIDLGYGLKSGEKPEYRRYFESNGYVLKVIKPSLEVEEKVMQEAKDWVIENAYDYQTYNEGHDAWSCDKGVSSYDISNFGCYVIVKDESFYGVTFTVERTSGNGWNGSSYEGCAILLTDGTIIGSNEKNYFFSGEETETTKKDVYTLKKR